MGDVSNVIFSNGGVRNDKDKVFIYYASSDTQMHGAPYHNSRMCLEMMKRLGG